MKPRLPELKHLKRRPAKSSSRQKASATAKVRVRLAYSTKSGKMIQGLAETALGSPLLEKYKGKVKLIFTSPPYPLRTKKSYGNRTGQGFVYWLAALAPVLAEYMSKKG